MGKGYWNVWFNHIFKATKPHMFGHEIISIGCEEKEPKGINSTNWSGRLVEWFSAKSAYNVFVNF